MPPARRKSPAGSRQPPVPESMKDRGGDDEESDRNEADEAPASGGGATITGDTVVDGGASASDAKFQQSYGALLGPDEDAAAAGTLLFPELPYSNWGDATIGTASKTPRQCRICLCTEDEESDAGDKGGDNNLIAPCQCRGGAQWVHRACLDKWRATQEDRAFAQCTECHFLYRFECVEEDGNGGGNIARPWSDRQLRCRYWTSVVRDTVLSLFGVVALVAALSALVWVFGVRGPTQAGTNTAAVPPSTPGNGTTIDSTTPCEDAACQVGFSLAGGICILLTVLGCYGMFLLCIHDCSPREVMDDIAGGETRQQRGQRNSCTGDCCSGCYCGPCDCGGGNDECCVFVVLVFGVVLLILGFFVGMTMAVVKVRYTLQKYSWMLQKRRLAKIFRIRDLDGIDLDGLGDAESGAAAVKPSAPVEPTASPSDARFLKEMGLLE